MEASVAARESWLKEIGQALMPTHKAEIAHALHLLAEAATRAEGHDIPVEDADAPAAHQQGLAARAKKKAER